MFKLIRYFSVASLIVFGLVFIPLSLIVPKRVNQVVLQAESAKSAELITVFANSLGTNFFELALSTQEFSGQPLLIDSRLGLFDAEVRKRMEGSSVVKVNFFNAEGNTIYSSTAADIGQSKHDSAGFIKARQGEVFSEGQRRESFESMGGDLKNRFIVSTYAPVKDDSGNVIAVLELYSDVTKVRSVVDRARRTLTYLPSLIALTLFSFLFLIVRHGESVMKKQYKELSEVKEKLELQASALKRSNEELELFAYIASHDLQEPLRKVQAFGDRLAKKYGDVLGENGLMYLERMQDASGRMRTLIQDLLAYSRVASNGEPFVSVDLNVIVENVVSDLEIRIAETKATVNVAELPKLQADPLQMRQLFQNLIGNALKFHKPDVAPIINVSCEKKQDKLLITVKDNGVGFDKQYAEKVFQIFQRLYGRGEFEGTGMGLAIVRKIVERHGGSISADSAEGEGASFQISFYSHELPKEVPLNPKQTLILKPLTA